ncbi:hypothetical protein V8G54_037533 [Vigna mungo]|uniref:Uncharacterized protein n=1 Tax=Vigna mungo TaxID=3915 RepID=A0AAQ3MIR1_VIGMU
MRCRKLKDGCRGNVGSTSNLKPTSVSFFIISTHCGAPRRRPKPTIAASPTSGQRRCRQPSEASPEKRLPSHSRDPAVGVVLFFLLTQACLGCDSQLSVSLENEDDA